MGSRLMPAGRDNPLGFFENLDFVEFHERWLRLNGYDRAGWAAPQQVHLSDEAYEEAAAIVSHNDMTSAWGWKDPRTTLFAEFWSEQLPHANFILLYREPTAVIDSLLRRRDEAITVQPELAGRAWMAHNEMLLQFLSSRRRRCLLVNVAAVARDSRAFLQMVAERLNLDINISVASTFQQELMTPVEAGSAKYTLLRYLAPEYGRIYEDLERKADLPGGLDKTVSISERHARRAFFSGWSGEHAYVAPVRRQFELAKSAEFEGAPATSDAHKIVSGVQRVLEDHKRALIHFKHLVGEE